MIFVPARPRRPRAATVHIMPIIVRPFRWSARLKMRAISRLWASRRTSFRKVRGRGGSPARSKTERAAVVATDGDEDLDGGCVMTAEAVKPGGSAPADHRGWPGGQMREPQVLLPAGRGTGDDEQAAAAFQPLASPTSRPQQRRRRR